MQCARVHPGRAGVGITPGAVLVKERTSARLGDAHRPVDLAVQREGGAVAHQQGDIGSGNGEIVIDRVGARDVGGHDGICERERISINCKSAARTIKSNLV